MLNCSCFPVGTTLASIAQPRTISQALSTESNSNTSAKLITGAKFATTPLLSTTPVSRNLSTMLVSAVGRQLKSDRPQRSVDPNLISAKASLKNMTKDSIVPPTEFPTKMKASKKRN